VNNIHISDRNNDIPVFIVIYLSVTKYGHIHLSTEYFILDRAINYIMFLL